VLVADSSEDDSFQRVTIIDTPRTGIVARGARRMVVANSFVTGWTDAGIRLDGTRTTGLYYNTVVGLPLGTGAAVHLQGATDVQAIDNILVSRGGDSSACYRISGAWPLRAGGSDYNDLYVAGSGATGRVNDTLYRTLADWCTLPWTPDLSSIAADPMFAADTDFHILTNSPCRDSGTPVPGFEFDIDADERDPVSPDIGADEFQPGAVAGEDPVPASAFLRIAGSVADAAARVQYTLPAAADVELRLFDATGRSVLLFRPGRQEAGRHDLDLQLDHLAPGAYLLRLRAGARRAVAKIVMATD